MRKMGSVLILATKLLSGMKDLFLCFCFCQTFPLKSFNVNLVAQCFRHFVALNSVAKSFSSSGYACVCGREGGTCCGNYIPLSISLNKKNSFSLLFKALPLAIIVNDA